MSKKKLFDDSTDWAIAFFVVLLLWLAFGEPALAEEPKVEYSIEYAHDSNAGTTSFNSGLDRICGRAKAKSGFFVTFCPVVAVRGTPKRDSFELGVGDELWPRWEGQITLNRFDGEMAGGFSIRRVVGDGKFRAFIGGSYWIDESPGSNSHFTFNLGLRYTF